MIIPVLPQTPFNYSYLSGGATEEVVIADRIPVSDARTIALSVRIHELNLTSGASFGFKIYGMDPSRTDGTVFVTSTAIGDTGAITTASPNLIGLSAIISDPVHPFVRVVMTAKGPSATGTTYAELSADLVVRKATPRQDTKALVRGMQKAMFANLQPGTMGTPIANFPDSIGVDPQAATTSIVCFTASMILRSLLSLCCSPSANHGEGYCGPDEGGGGDGE